MTDPQIGDFLADHLKKENRVVVILSANAEGNGGDISFSMVTTGAVSNVNAVYNDLLTALNAVVDAAVAQSSRVGDA